jgi:hypothetical protein
MKIADIRRVIESLNWNRHDLGGATRDEFRRMDVRTRLTKHIEAVSALVIPPRFADDAQDAAEAIQRARDVIARWEQMQTGTPTPVTPRAPVLVCLQGGRVH